MTMSFSKPWVWWNVFLVYLQYTPLGHLEPPKSDRGHRSRQRYVWQDFPSQSFCYCTFTETHKRTFIFPATAYSAVKEGRGALSPATAQFIVHFIISPYHEANMLSDDFFVRLQIIPVRPLTELAVQPCPSSKEQKAAGDKEVWSTRLSNKHTPYSNQGRSQPHTPRWARWIYFLNPSSSTCIFSLFPPIFFIFFLILVFRMGGSPTLKGPGYATDLITHLTI